MGAKYMLNFVICDDNINVIETIKKFLDAIFIENNIDAKITFYSTNPNDILRFAEDNKIDVIILDVELKSDKTGVDVATELRKYSKILYIIFLTGYMDYVFQSLKAKVFDYLLKPITFEKLEECILRLIEDMRGKNYYICLNNRITVNQNDIVFVEKVGIKSIVHTKDSEIPVYSTLENIYNNLSRNFVRCHKSYIVNIDKIQNIDYTENTLSLDNNHKCSIGLKYKFGLLEVLKNANNLGTIANT